MPTSKKLKSKVGASSAVAEGSVASSTKKSTSSGVSKKERGYLFFEETRQEVKGAESNLTR